MQKLPSQTQHMFPDAVLEFQGPYRWLSNFWPASFVFGGRSWPSVEHAYQAMKTLDPEMQEKIRAAKTPGQAKRMGKQVTLHSNFENHKVDLMRELVREKFKQNRQLQEALLATGKAFLVEGNHWGDRFWGVCRGEGRNVLGQILMEVRTEFRT